MSQGETNVNDAALEAALNDPASAPTAEVGDAAEIVKRLEADLARANLEVLKAQAEFENFRRRVRRDAEEELRYAALPLVRDLLPIIDNLQRAMQAAEQSGAGGGLIDGVKLVSVQFEQALAKHGCVEIAAMGTEFDPNVHQAIGQEAHAEIAQGHVSKLTQSGYRMHDRVVRPALVFVSTGSP